MKQVKTSLFFAFVLCVLIGYFEPANAAKSLLIAPPSGTSSYVAMNTTSGICPFWPNPISYTSSLTAISLEYITSASITTSGGKPSAVSVLAYGQPFPLGVVELNQYFVPDQYNNLTGTTLGLPSLPAGNYILTVNTKSGNAYITRITITD
jgi:hypothetical protein